MLELQPACLAVGVPLGERVAVALEAEPGHEGTADLEVLREVVDDQPPIVGPAEQHHVARHRDEVEPTRQLHACEIVDEPGHLRCLAAGGGDHVRIEIDALDIAAATCQLDRHAARATSGVEDRSAGQRCQQISLAVHVVTGGHRTREALVVVVRCRSARRHSTQRGDTRAALARGSSALRSVTRRL